MIKFYYSTAPNPMKVALCLEEMGLAYEPIPVDTRKGEQHKPGYLAINPNAKVPSIVDGEVTMFDSNAIVLYLAEKTGKFLPKKAADRAADALVADVRRLGHRAVHRPVRALQELRAGEDRLRSRPLRVRGAAPLGHRGRAPGEEQVHGWRYLHRRRHGAVGLGAAGAEHPGRARGEAWQREAPGGRDQRPPGSAEGDCPQGPHAFKTEMDDEAKRAMFPGNYRLAG